MINKKDFEDIRKKLEKADTERENLIKRSRDLLKLSKQIIYSVHRNDVNRAKNLINKIKKEYILLKSIAEKNPELLYCGSFKVAVQEYVEALAFFDIFNKNRLPTHKKLEVFHEFYLLGVCDLMGELVRKAVNETIKGREKNALEIKDAVDNIYSELLLLDIRNSELRKKFDGIKYDLRRLEDMALGIKFKK